MDREWGSKPGSGGRRLLPKRSHRPQRASPKTRPRDRRPCKDPYFMRNHLGSYECKLCLTLHKNEGNYLAHTQGKSHQTNLARASCSYISKTKAPETKKPQPPLQEIVQEFNSLNDLGPANVLSRHTLPDY
ncbi:hypothetical protein L3X38_022015 [Prunus dulcis]|uniref:Matrin-type domain-containing protein n=1 Tax=Prunus dulcis TaxID=3755 RepID=A0AAD4VV55_PRUDU|nr:hypothetical protein L3X38_022015 [Prunus dulcis]